jgi:REP element-mobilizing transposase RayT
MPSPRIAFTEKNEIYFLTLTVIDWIPIFTNEEYFNIIIDNLKFYCNKINTRIFGYVIMLNHIHLIIQSDDAINFTKSLKGYTTKAILTKLQKDNRPYYKSLIVSGRIWQKTNMPILIYSEKFFNQKLDYIHNNPVEKGYVESPEDWIYSSARNYYNDDHSIIFVETEF